MDLITLSDVHIMTGKELIDSVIESKSTGEYNPNMLSLGPEGLREALSCLYNSESDSALYGLLKSMFAMMGPAKQVGQELATALSKSPPGYFSIKETLYWYAQLMLDHLDSISEAAIEKENVYQECREFFRKISEEFPLVKVNVDIVKYLQEFYDAVNKKDAYNAYNKAMSDLNTVSPEESMKMSRIKDMIRSRLDVLENTPDPLSLLTPLVDALKAELVGKIIYNPAYPSGVCRVADVSIGNNNEFLDVHGMILFDHDGMLYATKGDTHIKLLQLDASGIFEIDR